ncbi:MAG: GNAT family N-acetyltransferase [Candidatus Harrisonbacteria bacterium]|nr:GNAT family N-acetyltransferase [Candidatus Harrisonbacteria bacterium]
MKIRKATARDTLAIIALMKQLIDEHRRSDKYYKPFSLYRGLPEYVQKAIRDSKKLLLTAEMDKKIVGYLLVAIEPAPFYSSEKKIGVIADTVVSKKYRRQGILKKMFLQAQKWLRGKKIRYFELSVDARNKSAVRSWKKLGFSNYKLRLRKA